MIIISKIDIECNMCECRLNKHLKYHSNFLFERACVCVFMRKSSASKHSRILSEMKKQLPEVGMAYITAKFITQMGDVLCSTCPSWYTPKTGMKHICRLGKCSHVCCVIENSRLISLIFVFNVMPSCICFACALHLFPDDTHANPFGDLHDYLLVRRCLIASI